ncbi:unnamed protein product [Microthlaspi erraticum]|uniref:NYN domain-containing protein n=1 Tax=Microthlaspi erraticum TaxID=1685480 RepID=A0A6D2L6C2_9BRAS|nr:unnamed protein product [Microthlaspi erraticum]
MSGTCKCIHSDSGEKSPETVIGVNTVAEAQYEDAQTWVCWDIEDCPVPRGCKPEKIAEQIRSALAKLNYVGPISISAYGNMNRIPSSMKKALSSSGVVLNHVPPSEFRQYIFDEILFWPCQSPAPANVMVITRDESLSSMLRKKQLDGRYNVLLALPRNASEYLAASAKTTWVWRSLLLDEP